MNTEIDKCLNSLRSRHINGIYAENILLAAEALLTYSSESVDALVA